MKRNRLRIMGICLLVCGLFILSLFAYKKISRELYLRNLLKENIVLEIPSLNIKVPVLEGTDSKTLAVAAGHFPGTGELGQGNYCIAGHNIPPDWQEYYSPPPASDNSWPPIMQ